MRRKMSEYSLMAIVFSTVLSKQSGIMLKNLLFSKFSSHLNIKCGEIYQSSDTFTIVCTQCEIKLFDFEDFLLHIRNLHSYKQALLKENEQNNKDSEENEGIKTEYILDEEEVIRIFAHNKNEKPLDEVRFETSDKLMQDEAIAHSLSSEEDFPDESGPLNNDFLEEQVNSIIKKKIYSCNFCTKSYGHPSTLRRHVDEKHIKPRYHKCPHCTEEYHTFRSLEGHIRKKHTKYVCEMCGKFYKTAESLRDHKDTHNETKSYTCTVEGCVSAFKHKKLLQRHMLVHSEGPKYICELCGYNTVRKPGFEVHMRTHTGERPYKCPVCEKAFKTKSSINEHMPIHSSDRPYKCDICGACFSRPKALYHHKFIHAETKQFVCKICGNSYAQAAGLSSHMRSHRVPNERTC